jgi:ABC-type Fe3+/spermidine/putrescine transport system ATPase subunit
MSYLKIKNLHKNFEAFSLHVENIQIPKGCFFGILGYSGAGKSTLLNLLCGFENPDKGEIEINEKSILSLKPHQREIAYVFQNSLLFEGLSVYENLAYLLKAKGVRVENSFLEKSLKECEVLHLKNREIQSLSGGERQRVALAMALMFRPKLLLLDEPFSNLDTALKIKMRLFLKKIISSHNITAIMVTHDKDDAFLLFDSMILLEKGKILQQGTPQSIYEKPSSLQVVKYFGIENIFKGYVKDNLFRNDFLSMEFSYEDTNDVFLVIPYEAISLGEEFVQEVSSTIYIEGRYKITLKSGLVFFSQKALQGSIGINIQTQKCFMFKDELC